jgi:hypothetical protein
VQLASQVFSQLIFLLFWRWTRNASWEVSKLVTYKKLDGLADYTTLDISPFLKAALPWIEEVLKEESNRVLLHCAAGQSRSGAMLVG